MMTAVASPPSPGLAQIALFGPRRVTLAQYRQLFEIGFLTPDDRVELLDGYVVEKAVINPPHAGTVRRLTARLPRYLPSGWTAQFQDPVELPQDGEPQPDAAVIRGDETSYDTRHPGPDDIGLVVEVSDSTLRLDRVEKGRLYAREGLPVYWVVNLVDRVIEVYADPDPQAGLYRSRADYRPGDAVPLVLDGVAVAQLPVTDVIP